jgi:hypothetical protein
MAVVIHEFEVVSEPPGRGQGGEQPVGEAKKTAAEGPTAADVERIVRRAHARRLRVSVH